MFNRVREGTISISILPADSVSVRRHIATLTDNRSNSWIYLGKNILLRNTLGEIFDAAGVARTEIGRDLQEIARNCRQEYVDYIGLLAPNDPNGCWWLTSISEKSPYASDAFLHICYLILCLRYAKNLSGDIIVVCESPALARSLYANLQRIPEVRIAHSCAIAHARLEELRQSLASVVQKGVFASRYTLRVVASRFFAATRRRRCETSAQSPLVAIHSWMDERAFADPSAYRDAFFGDLGKNLEERGKQVITIANVLPTMHYHRAVRELLHRQDDTIMLLEEFVTIADVLQALIRVKKGRFGLGNIPRFSGLDVGDIVIEELRHDRLNTRGEQSYLMYRASMAIGDRFKVGTFVYTFENHMWEKMLCLGMRKRSPETELTGYAHSIVSPMYTFYSVSRYERDRIPLPDRIVVNGPRAKDVLVASGFETVDIHIAGAVRYRNLLVTPPAESIPKTSPVVLVTPSTGFYDALELVHKVLGAFKDKPQIQVVIKPHPSLPIDALTSHIPGLPPHIWISTQPVSELLARADILLYTESATSIEALFRGIPVVHVQSDLRIDMNPLEGYDLVPSVAGPEELASTVHRLLSTSHVRRSEYRRIAAEFFAPVRDDFAEIFVIGEAPGSRGSLDTCT